MKNTSIKMIECLLAILFLLAPTLAQERTVGLITNTDEAYDGYVLFTPQFNEFVYLMDNDGRILHSWEIEGTRAIREAQMLDNGHLMLIANPRNDIDESLIPGHYLPDGSIREYTWNGDLVWEYQFVDATPRQHHGFYIMPNGNVLVIVWDYIPIEEAVAVGLDPTLVDEIFTENPFILPDRVIEIDRTTSDIVWQWHAWDHLIQDFDPELPNYGDVTENWRRIDINYHANLIKNTGGYGANAYSDWMHANAVSYSPELDQIALSVHSFDEFWIIDHSISTEDAQGRAGDLLYRWGNPFAYGVGELADRKLFGQHDIQWIESDLLGAGNWLIFNNRNNYGADEYSTLLELSPALNDDGTYDWSGETDIVWSYQQDGFYSRNVSSVQRLPNGNTFFIEGFFGRMTEINPEGDVVWQYVNPSTANGIIAQGEPANPEGIAGMERNTLFRVRKYSTDFIGFEGQHLTPGEPLVD